MQCSCPCPQQLFTGCPVEIPGGATAVELAAWLLGATRAKASSSSECMVCRASSMDGCGGTYCDTSCEGSPGNFPRSTEDDVCGSGGKSGSDWRKWKVKGSHREDLTSFKAPGGLQSEQHCLCQNHSTCPLPSTLLHAHTQHQQLNYFIQCDLKDTDLR